MNSVKIRVFVTTSHLSTIYMTLLARKTAPEGYKDVLLIDTGTRRDVLIRLIEETASFHNWHVLHNFSGSVGADFDYKTGTRKKLTRKFKNFFLISWFYKLMLRRYMKRREQEYIEKLKKVKGLDGSFPVTELYLMTETYLNHPLMKLFPDASVSYMEHGMGDYYHILTAKTRPGKLYCVFSEPYRHYLESKGLACGWVYDLPGKDGFRDLAEKLLAVHANTLHTERLPKTDKPVVFILLETPHVYNVPQSYWTAYIDHIFTRIDDPKKYHFILKPHPMHSREHQKITLGYLDKKGIEYSLLGSDELASASAEVLFSMWAGQTKHVFSIFSSACYYLSELYDGNGISFWHSAGFLEKNIGNAPRQYYTLFKELQPLVNEVFTLKCRKIGD